MDKDENSKGGDDVESVKDNDSIPEIIEVKEDSQDGGPSSPIAVESPPPGSR